MRTERVSQDVNAWLHVRSSGGSADQHLDDLLRERLDASAHGYRTERRLGLWRRAYFNAVITKLNSIAEAFDQLPASVRSATLARLVRVRNRGKSIGWGYGDYLDDVVSALEGRASQRG